MNDAAQDRILCFTLNGYILGVEPDQIEKILFSKQPAKSSFTLETGVEVKSLLDCIPLPGEQKPRAEHILFIKDQKDFYGFTVDRVQGYIKLKGHARIPGGGERMPVKYFLRAEEKLIPVLDLQYVTNSDQPVSQDVVDEIINYAQLQEGLEEGERDEIFSEASEDEIYHLIEDEINKEKTPAYADEVIKSEKKGLLLPLIVNVAIVVIFTSGIGFYIMLNRERTREQVVGKNVSGVEEQVIKEIRRRSEAEVADQKKKLGEVKQRLSTLQKERDFFLENQDKILSEKEQALNEEFQRKLEETRQRIVASGVSNVDEELEKERIRLNRELLQSKDQARGEMEKAKQEYEKVLQQKQSELNREISLYSDRIKGIEQELREKQAELKATEEKFQSTLTSQQEYITFRRELNTVYSKALGYLSNKEYTRGIDELNTILPIIERARQQGVGEKRELDVEEKLVRNVLSLAENEQKRVDLNKVAAETFESASKLEKLGNLKEALSRYYTVYTIAGTTDYKNRAYTRAESILEQLIAQRTTSEKKSIDENADALFQTAINLKRGGQYESAKKTLETIITEYPESSKTRDSLKEIGIINSLEQQQEAKKKQQQMNETANEIIKSARRSYENGYYSEALEKYEEIIRKYQESDYTDVALSEIIRINKEIRSGTEKSAVVFAGEKAKTGVIIQLSSSSSFLFNLGTKDGVKRGDVLGVYRKEGEKLTFIGNVMVSEAYPTISKGKIMYFEKKIRVGDIVSLS